MSNFIKKINEQLSHVYWDTAPPDNVDYQFTVTQGRAATDEIECIFRGVAVPETDDPTRYSPPALTYQSLQEAFDTSSTSGKYRIYSARNTFNRFNVSWATGWFMSMQDFIDTFYPSFGFSFDDFCTLAGAKLTLTSGGYTITILGSQINDGTRNSYTNEDGTLRGQYGCGFVFEPATEDEPDTVRFAIGQLVPSEQTSQEFLTLADGGTTIKFTADSTNPQWKQFSAFVSHTIGSDNPTEIPPEGLGDAEVNDYLRFAIGRDQMDLLSDARLYYTYSTTGTPSDPSVLTSEIYNVQAGQYQAPFNAYGVALQLTTAATYQFKVFAYGQGAEDTQIYEYTITVS